LLVDSSTKHSSNWSFRNAVSLFLTKLRLGIGNKILITIFRFANSQAVFRTLSVVHHGMLTNFVPSYLGFNHISRQDVVHNHSSPLTTPLLTEQPNTDVLGIDGTYLYIQICNIYFLSQYWLSLLYFRRVKTTICSDEHTTFISIDHLSNLWWLQSSQIILTKNKGGIG
jgi:hypothetical protein